MVKTQRNRTHPLTWNPNSRHCIIRVQLPVNLNQRLYPYRMVALELLPTPCPTKTCSSGFKSNPAQQHDASTVESAPTTNPGPAVSFQGNCPFEHEESCIHYQSEIALKMLTKLRGSCSWWKPTKSSVFYKPSPQKRPLTCSLE